jgi:crossover junction endodeoxyribonuclease RuvC
VKGKALRHRLASLPSLPKRAEENSVHSAAVAQQSSPDSRTRILGIDPGLRVTGFGVLDKSGNQLSYVTSGCIRTSDGELPARLRTILDGLAEIITTCQPGQVALEKVFVNANPHTTLLLGQARGTAICAAVMHKLPVSEYTALQVKQAVVGNGHAKKEQVQDMVKRLLKLAGDPSPDAADALACAICHAHGGQGLGKLATAGYRMKRGRLV